MIRPVNLRHHAKTMIMYLNVCLSVCVSVSLSVCLSLSLSVSLSLSEWMYLISRPGLIRYIKSLIVESSARHVSRCLDQNPRRPIWHLELMHHLNIMLWKTLKLKTNVFMYPSIRYNSDMRKNASNCCHSYICKYWAILSWHEPKYFGSQTFFDSLCWF